MPSSSSRTCSGPTTAPSTWPRRVADFAPARPALRRARQPADRGGMQRRDRQARRRYRTGWRRSASPLAATCASARLSARAAGPGRASLCIWLGRRGLDRADRGRRRAAGLGMGAHVRLATTRALPGLRGAGRGAARPGSLAVADHVRWRCSAAGVGFGWPGALARRPCRDADRSRPARLAGLRRALYRPRRAWR